MTYETYIRRWHERIAQNDARRRHREAKAHRMLPKLVTHLVDEYGVRRILLFGSLAEGHFDIDLAVEGLDGAALFRAGAELEEIAQHFRVDLIPMEQAYPELLRHLEQHGKQLYGG